MTSETANGQTVTMVYDAFGNRVSKTVNGVTTQYLVEDDVNPAGYPQVVEELVNGAVTRQYTHGLQRISENQIINGTWMPSFYGYDGFGSVWQLTNSSGPSLILTSMMLLGILLIRQERRPTIICIAANNLIPSWFVLSARKILQSVDGTLPISRS